MKILFKITHLSKASFGSHWKWISKKFDRGKGTTQDLMRTCAIIQQLPDFDLDVSAIKKAQLLEMVTDHRRLKANDWYKSVDHIVEKLSKQKGSNSRWSGTQRIGRCRCPTVTERWQWECPRWERQEWQHPMMKHDKAGRKMVLKDTWWEWALMRQEQSY